MRDVTSLRRSQPAPAPKVEGETAPPARYDVEWAPTPGSAPANDRRKSGDPGRRGMDKLRADALKAVISQVEDRNFNGLRERAHWSRILPPSRIALIVVALMAAGGAAWLALQHEEPAVATTMPVEPVKAPTTQVLVAKEAIAPGDRLSPTALEWQDWPDTTLHDDFITITSRPNALSDMVGILARTEIAAGSPVLDQELIPASGGYLAAILEQGMRGVSVNVTAEGASGGFVVPNDRVDVVLTRQSDQGRQDSQTILHDVRVLAINTRVSPTTAAAATSASDDPSGSNAASEAFIDHALATLELDPKQAEIIINATTLGRLSLMLRPAAEVGAPAAAEEQRAAANAAIRLTSPFWTK